MTSPVTRTAADRCPGLLRPSQAADGALVRLRLPGGATTADTLRELSDHAVRYGDGTVQITSRGNVQVRGIRLDESGEVPADLQDAVLRLGLLPSLPHERVRNIVASPLTGLVGGLADLRPATRRLDRLLCSTPALVGLPGRFLFCLDDGRDDVGMLRHDLGLRAVSPTQAQVTVGERRGLDVFDLDDAVACIVELATRFVELVESAGEAAPWHVAELPGSGAELFDGAATPQPTGFTMPYGPLVQSDGRVALSLLVPLGLLDADQVAAVAAVASGPVVLTPWRGLVLGDLTPSEVDAALERLGLSGLIADASTGWTGLTACAGAPGCGRASVSTRDLARSLATGVRVPSADAVPVHVVACERRCGLPSTDHVEVLATAAEGITVGRGDRRRSASAGTLVQSVDTLRGPG